MPPCASDNFGCNLSGKASRAACQRASRGDRSTVRRVPRPACQRFGSSGEHRNAATVRAGFATIERRNAGKPSGLSAGKDSPPDSGKPSGLSAVRPSAPIPASRGEHRTRRRNAAQPFDRAPPVYPASRGDRSTVATVRRVRPVSDSGQCQRARIPATVANIGTPPPSEAATVRPWRTSNAGTPRRQSIRQPFDRVPDSPRLSAVRPCAAPVSGQAVANIGTPPEVCRACQRFGSFGKPSGLSAIPATVPPVYPASRGDRVPPVSDSGGQAVANIGTPRNRSTVRRPLPKTGVFAPLFSTVKHETPILQGRKRPAVAFRGIFTRRNTPAPILSGHCQRASRPAKTLTENPNRAASLSGKPSGLLANAGSGRPSAPRPASDDSGGQGFRQAVRQSIRRPFASRHHRTRRRIPASRPACQRFGSSGKPSATIAGNAPQPPAVASARAGRVRARLALPRHCKAV